MKIVKNLRCRLDDVNLRHSAILFVIGFLAVCFLGVPFKAQAEGPVKWKYYHITPPLHHDVSTMREFASDVQKLTNGELQIKVYSLGEVPYKPTEAVSVIRDRFMDGGVLVSDFVSGEIPFFNFTNLPMLVTDVGEQAKAMPILVPYLERELKKRGLTLLFWRYNSQKELFGRGKAIEKLDDFKGRKIRSFGLADSEFLKRFGAIPVSMSSTEVSTAMQRGVMDAFIASAFYSVGLRWDETCDWGYLMDMTAITSYECVNSKSLAELSTANQKTLFDTAAKYQVRWNKEILELEDKARESMAKGGKKMIKMTQMDRVRATERIKPFWDEWANSVGPDAVEALRKVRGVLGK